MVVIFDGLCRGVQWITNIMVVMVDINKGQYNHIDATYHYNGCVHNYV